MKNAASSGRRRGADQQDKGKENNPAAALAQAYVVQLTEFRTHRLWGRFDHRERALQEGAALRAYGFGAAALALS